MAAAAEARRQARGLLRRLRGRARPAVYRLRRAAAAVDRLLRPPVEWDGRHHPTMLRFEPWAGQADGRFVHDFLGVRIDPKFRVEFRPDAPGPHVTTYPRPDWSYFEMVFVLEAVLEFAASSRERFGMVELGAGYGPWLVAAHAALRRLTDRPARLTGIEMEPQRFRWIAEHMRNNGIDPGEHEQIHAAVSDRDGEALFHAGGAPDLEYGLRVSGRRDNPDVDAGPGRVPCVSLSTVLRGRAPLELMHVDVQGEEGRFLRDGEAELRRGVRRLVVATHSRSIHRRIRRVLSGDAWECRWNFHLRRRERTDLGDVQFLDGLLAYVNRTL